jgi:hypothetical protein
MNTTPTSPLQKSPPYTFCPIAHRAQSPSHTRNSANVGSPCHSPGSGYPPANYPSAASSSSSSFFNGKMQPQGATLVNSIVTANDNSKSLRLTQTIIGTGNSKPVYLGFSQVDGLETPVAVHTSHGQRPDAYLPRSTCQNIFQTCEQGQATYYYESELGIPLNYLASKLKLETEQAPSSEVALSRATNTALLALVSKLSSHIATVYSDSSHRDIKPHNAILLPNGQVKLIDCANPVNFGDKISTDDATDLFRAPELNMAPKRKASFFDSTPQDAHAGIDTFSLIKTADALVSPIPVGNFLDHYIQPSQLMKNISAQVLNAAGSKRSDPHSVTQIINQELYSELQALSPEEIQGLNDTLSTKVNTIAQEFYTKLGLDTPNFTFDISSLLLEKNRRVPTSSAAPSTLSSSSAPESMALSLPPFLSPSAHTSPMSPPHTQSVFSFSLPDYAASRSARNASTSNSNSNAQKAKPTDNS